MKEVEIKIKISEGQRDKIARQLRLGYKVVPHTLREKDIYYTNKYKDFIETKECLRIRQIDNNCVLTWKPPTDPVMANSGQFWKEEVDIFLGDQVEKTRLLLNKLDFVEYSVVDKERLVFEIDSQTKILLDEIRGVGCFVEIETLSKDVEAAKSRNMELFKSFGMETTCIETRPYRDIVKAHQQNEPA